MLPIFSSENDSLLQSFDIIRISPVPEDAEKHTEDHNKNAISLDTLSFNIIDSMLSNHTPYNSFPFEGSGAPSFVSNISQESVIVNNRDSESSAGPNKSLISPEIQRTCLKNSRTVNSLNDIDPKIIMDKIQISNIADYSYIGSNGDSSSVLELQARFKNTEEILKRNNIKLHQQYTKIQKFQNDVQEDAKLSKKQIEERDRENLALKAIINDLENKLDDLKVQNDSSQKNIRKHLNCLATENFKLKKTISEKLAIISNMSAATLPIATILITEHKAKLNEVERNNSTLLAENTELRDLTTKFRRQIQALEFQLVEVQGHSRNKLVEIERVNTDLANEKRKTTELAGRIGVLEIYLAKQNESERNASALLAENAELRDLAMKFRSEIHARDVHLAEGEKRNHYKITEIERVNADLANEKHKTAELCDRIGVLEIYLADCKSDFEWERQERAALAGNREKLLNDLKLLQKRNQQLFDELKQLNEAALASKTQVSRPNATSPGDIHLETQSLSICPICSRHFINYAALHNHIQQCLE